MLGMIIQMVTGRPWYVEAKERVIAPLGLTHTSWPDGSASLPRPHAQGTVPVSKELSQYWPGARYGLGLIQRPLSCGGTYLGHGGDILGFATRTGVTADGSRSVMISISTERWDSLKHDQRVEAAANRLINRALCATR